MHDCLKEAQRLAEKIRFSGDTIKVESTEIVLRSERLRGMALSSGVKLSKELTPLLYESLEAACKRLLIPVDTVDAFVYASPEIQAECYSGNEKSCIIRFTSALIELMDPREFEFVVGHELGHFLLRHGRARVEHNLPSIEYFIQQRAQEISVDRVGLIACDSLNVAIKALMKMVSGVGGRYLRFDVGTFLTQLRGALDGGKLDAIEATHPSTLIRCRALLWFSLTEFFNHGPQTGVSDSIVIIDQKLQNDLDRYVDGPAKARISAAKENLAMWLRVRDVVAMGIFTKLEQSKFAKRFGRDSLSSLLNFFETIPQNEVEAEVSKRLSEAKEDLAFLIPISFESEYQKLIENVY